MIRLSVCVSLMTLAAVHLHATVQRGAPAGLWHAVDPSLASPVTELQPVNPRGFGVFQLDSTVLDKVLSAALDEASLIRSISPVEIDLPMPDGSLARFWFVESPVMCPELAAKFPELRTFRGQGVDDPWASMRFDVTPAGFHAQILSPRGTVYVDPLSRSDACLHMSYFKQDVAHAGDWRCWTADSLVAAVPASNRRDVARPDTNLRTYRLAVAATGEYTAYHGGTVAAGLAAVVTALNRVTGIYEMELAIRFLLVANNDQLIYTDPNTDPYSNQDASALLNQNQANLDAIVGDSNYDLGHVFSTAGGGLAGVGVACRSGVKARGETGAASPTGDAFWVDYVAHEIGHQFGASHTFNSGLGSCGQNNRDALTAFEPGGGSTIMAYAGSCAGDSLQPHNDPYFHTASLEQIITYITAGSGSYCPTLTATGNTSPAVTAGPTHTIPQGTPFTLTATASDQEGDPLTCCWEEMDLGPSVNLTSPDNGSSPLFRSFTPTTNAWRTFPRTADILNRITTPGEKLPGTSRTLNFRVTVRDHHPGGGSANWADTQVSVMAVAGPFTLTSHNQGGSFSNETTVTWNVAGTTLDPINAAFVNILLSTNCGQDFSLPLAMNIPNDGSAQVALPNLETRTARLKVEPVDNIFFAIGNSNFTILPVPPAPVIQFFNLTNTIVTLKWTASPGRTYRVQQKTDLSGASWSDLTPSVVADGSFASATNNVGEMTSGFYRVVLLP